MLDVLGRSLEVGRKYRVGQAHQKTRAIVTIEEDFENGCLLVVDKNGSRMRIDELDPSNVFETVGDDEVAAAAQSDLKKRLDDIDYRAGSSRYTLDELEKHACDLLGCAMGDDSDMSDAVSRCIRDGVGSLSDLV